MSIQAVAKKALSRRGFLRAMPAAPLAAPAIASEAMHGMGIPPSSGGLPIGLAGAQASELAWAKEHRSRLEKLVFGKRDERDDLEERFHDVRAIACHFDSLRSVSPVMRSRMYADTMKRRQRDERKAWARIELKDLMKRFFS